MDEKQLYGHFKRQAKSHYKTWTWLRKRNLKKETESVLIAAQNNAIRTISEQKMTKHYKRADIAYVVTETK